jgi:hypothetical protein
MSLYGQGEKFNAGTGEQQVFYNPAYGQAVTLMPEWHFNDLFFARGRLFMQQEFTVSDSTTRRHEVELSDTLLDVGWTGWKEENTKIRVRGDIRFTLPTSRISQMRTQWFAVGPSVIVGRGFSLLGGLSVNYSVRPTVRFNQYTTARVASPTLSGCGDIQSISCLESANDGTANGFFDVTHGPVISMQFTDSLSLTAMFLMSRIWLYSFSTPAQFQGAQGIQSQANATTVRDVTRFILSATWQFSKPVSLSLTAFTVGGQLGSDGVYIFPLFNRGTTMYLDFTVDVEAVTSKLF